MIRILAAVLWAVVSLAAQEVERTRVVTVTDEAGRPVAGARVRFEKPRGGHSMPMADLLLCSPLPAGRTDEAGRFEAPFDAAHESVLFRDEGLSLTVEHPGHQSWVESIEGLGTYRGSEVRLRRWTAAESVRVACPPDARLFVLRDGPGVIAEEILAPDQDGLVEVRVPLQPSPVFVPDRPQRLRTAVCLLLPGHEARWTELWPGMGAVALDTPPAVAGAKAVEPPGAQSSALFWATIPGLDGARAHTRFLSYPAGAPMPRFHGGCARLTYWHRPGCLAALAAQKPVDARGVWTVRDDKGEPLSGAVVWRTALGSVSLRPAHRFVTDGNGQFELTDEHLSDPGVLIAVAGGGSRASSLAGRGNGDRSLTIRPRRGGPVPVRVEVLEAGTGRPLEGAIVIGGAAVALAEWGLPRNPLGLGRTDADGVAKFTASAASVGSTWNAVLAGYRVVGAGELERDGATVVLMELERLEPIEVTAAQVGGAPAVFAPVFDRKPDSPRTDSSGGTRMWLAKSELPFAFRPPRHTLERRFEQEITKSGDGIVLPSGRALVVRMPFVSRLSWSARYDRGGAPPQDHASGPGYGAVITWGAGMQEVLLGGPGVATVRTRASDVTAATRVVDRSRTVRRVPVRFVAEGGVAVEGVRVSPRAAGAPSQVGDLMGDFVRTRQGRPELHFTDTREWQCLAYHPNYLPQRFAVPAKQDGQPERRIRVALTRGTAVRWSRTGPFDPHTHVRIVWHATNPKEQEEYREPVATFDTRLSATPSDDWVFQQPAAMAPGTYWVETTLGSVATEVRQITVGEDAVEVDL